MAVFGDNSSSGGGGGIGGSSLCLFTVRVSAKKLAIQTLLGEDENIKN